MVGFILKNILSDHGGVTRGMCSAEADGNKLYPQSYVSMNMWGFPGEEYQPVVAEQFKRLIRQKIYKEDLYSNL